MNPDVTQNERFLSSPPLLVSHRAQPVVLSTLPTLRDGLDEIGPLPKGTLFFGLAEDGLPVMLSLRDPRPGPVLIVGESGSGKTRLLDLIARFVAMTHSPDQTRYAVITHCPDQWSAHMNFAHCLGLFSVKEAGALNLTRALAMWMKIKKTDRQSIVLIIDGLEDLIHWSTIGPDLETLLLAGPAKQIWPIVTIQPSHCEAAEAWLKYFRTRIAALGPPQAWGFRVERNSRWITFRTPAI